MMKKKARKSVSMKEQAVLRLLKGEDMELVSRDSGFAMHELVQWHKKYMFGGRENLKSHPKDPHDTELEQRRRRDQVNQEGRGESGKEPRYRFRSKHSITWQQRITTVALRRATTRRPWASSARRMPWRRAAPSR